MSRFLFLTLDGLTHGAVYSAFALALVLIWRGNRVLNFAQAAMAVACAYTASSVSEATGSYWAGFAVAIPAGLVLGAVVERVLMRRSSHSFELDAVIVTVGLALLIQGVLGMVYGTDFRSLQAPVSQRAVTVGGVVLGSPYDLLVVGVVVALMIAMDVLFTRSPVGLRMRASAFAPDVSRLLGVDVGRMRTLGWALAAAVGALAALLTVPTQLGLYPNAMDLVFVSAFAAAVVGGLDSPAGAVVGGLGVGLALSYVSGYLGSAATALAVPALLITVLLVRPRGLFSPEGVRRV